MASLRRFRVSRQRRTAFLHAFVPDRLGHYRATHNASIAVGSLIRQDAADAPVEVDG
jgi:hypothetical protein